MKRRIFSMLLALTIVFSMSFAGGTAFAAEGIAISTPEDLKAMENNPSGSYYLANDIEVPENLSLFSIQNPFTGTFDGKGYKLKNYKITGTGSYMEKALFISAKNATFKNFSMTGIDINADTGTDGGIIGALVFSCTDCSFSNIKLSGSITLKTSRPSQDFGMEAAGLAVIVNGSGTISKCSSSVDITISAAGGDGEGSAAGLIGYFYGGTVKDCSNSGDITITGIPGTAAGIVNGCNSITSSKNSGKVTVNSGSVQRSMEAYSAAGVANDVLEKGTSCGNTGAISFTSQMDGCDSLTAAGVFGAAGTAAKCYNKGKVTLSGKAGLDSDGGIYAGGVGGKILKISESYNKGQVTVTAKDGGRSKALTGGITASVVDMKNCYNTATVTLKGDGYAGGLSGSATPWGEKVINNYTTGAVKSSGGAVKGQIIGYYDGAEVARKRNIYNNYYTNSGKAYGTSPITWKDWTAKATKVSSISKSKCPKLDSKYWTYSSKYKRMILKNNKEK